MPSSGSPTRPLEAEGLDRFDQLKAHLTGEDEPSTYRELAAAWGVGESAVRVSVHRLRKRFGRLLREEVAATVADPVDVDAELRHLLGILGGIEVTKRRRFFSLRGEVSRVKVQ